MRIVFIGASDLGRACCESLLDSGSNVVGILTAPQEFRISWSGSPVTNVRHSSFDDLAARHGLPLEVMRTRMSDTREWITSQRPDILIVIGWYHMIGRSLREIAPLGAVGIHASLLPRYRGGAPLVWAIINGEREAGVTLFQFEDGVDNGDVFGQERFAIGEDETIAEVVEKSRVASLQVLARCVPLLANGTAPRWKQNESEVTHVPQRRPEDGVIDWAGKSARQVYDWIRAQTRPYPGAFTQFGAERMVIWRASMTGAVAPADAEPGRLIAAQAAVVCADQRLLQLEEVQIGDDVMAGGDLTLRLGPTDLLLGGPQ